ncbi:hypothetical protein [Mycobacterium sp. 852002-51057_SCH5723018]|uniref:hypothetical protein n=1 Tax=Mycobacterium sp. 852002-51057_SCH5723018 TaxID=1834094 RepID=UPI0012E7FC11|nr:hypothetical protein [Mycobacterium sp. 852002-51057_SCH5723018]
MIDTMHALQVAWLPVDRRGAMQRIADFAKSAPPEIRRAAEDVSGVSARAMEKPDARAEVSTGAVAGDFAVLDNWCSWHCQQLPK